MSVFKQILLAGSISWVFAASLGLLFVTLASGHPSLGTLRIPGVVPVALILSTVAAVVMTPFAVWALRTGARNLCRYAPILWIVLAGWLIAVAPRNAAYGQYGALLLGLIGLIVLGVIPPSK